MTADGSAAPAPRVTIPRDFNAAVDLLDRNLAAGRGNKLAFVDDRASLTYAQLAERVDRAASALRRLGLQPEQRAMLCLLDTVDFPAVFLGAIKAGIVPVPVNTLLTPADYEFMLRDSRARALIVADALYDKLAPALVNQPALEHVVIAGTAPAGRLSFAALLAEAPVKAPAAATTCDDICFWLYSSGSPGVPKRAMHLHSHLTLTAELYAKPVLGIRETDTVYSAAKLFFDYGLGNALTFPMAVGATSILLAERPTPASVIRVLREKKPTIFYGVPTLYAALLSSGDLPQRGELALRRCVSAGEALPEDIGKRWTERLGVEILDGIGSTEMLHIFLSNRAGAVRYGTTGMPAPGYQDRLLDEQGRSLPPGETGALQCAGPTGAASYRH